MERKLQDHQQTLESLRQQSATEEEQLTHEAKLKKEANEVCVCVFGGVVVNSDHKLLRQEE